MSGQEEAPPDLRPRPDEDPADWAERVVQETNEGGPPWVGFPHAVLLWYHLGERFAPESSEMMQGALRWLIQEHPEALFAIYVDLMMVLRPAVLPPEDPEPWKDDELRRGLPGRGFLHDEFWEAIRQQSEAYRAEWDEAVENSRRERYREAIEELLDNLPDPDEPDEDDPDAEPDDHDD